MKMVLYDIPLIPTSEQEQRPQEDAPMIFVKMDIQSPSKEMAGLKSLMDKLISIGVNVVACQKQIHPWLQDYLLDKVQYNTKNDSHMI